MSLTADLRKIAKKKKQTLNQAYSSIMFDLANQMITMSPKDTGAFQANWLAALNTGDYTFDKSKTNVSEADGRLTVTLGSLTTDNNFYFTNSLPYAQKLENGHSEQAPSGVVRVTINDFPQIVDKRVRETRNK